MGQYHKLICPAASEFLHPATLTSGLKAPEQLHPVVTVPLAMLLAAPEGDAPRDLPWAGRGRWAGRAVLGAGDEARAGDLRHPDPVLSEQGVRLYDRAMPRATRRLTAKPRPAKHLLDIARSFLPVIERVCELRFAQLDDAGAHTGAMDYLAPVPVAWVDGHWDMDVDDPRERLFYERLGALDTFTAWRRGPAPLDTAPEAPDTLVGAARGVDRLWLNLDKGEYIDPAAFGDIPDAAGAATGSSGRAVLMTLFHQAGSGHGDIPDPAHLPFAGRWRGDRLVLAGPSGARHGGRDIDLTTLRGAFTDISPLARLALDALEANAPGLDWIEQITDGVIARSWPDWPGARALKRAVMRDATVRACLSHRDTLQILLVPPLRLRIQGLRGTHDIPAMVDVTARDRASGIASRVWLCEDTFSRIRDQLPGLDRRSRHLKRTHVETGLPAPLAHIEEIDLSSAHARIAMARLERQSD